MIENFISMLQVNFFVWVNVTSKILFSDIKRFMRKENFPKEDGEKKILMNVKINSCILSINRSNVSKYEKISLLIKEKCST
jgi:hypothetical protein